MVESSYKHNYEYLSIEEAKSIIGGTFVQGTTSIGGELATKSDIDKLITAADKRLTSMVPSTVANNEFVCFFECINNEDFPDDLQHRWIEVSPTRFMFPANGGSVNITGSYGLTGTLGTRKKVGDITDTITVEENNTESSKSGSKTYYYNNDQSQQPTIDFSWTQPSKDEEFPDDEAHRWIEITPTNAGNFTEAGGTITVTGSYGLTGSFGTKKTVGYINDTITVEKNTTTQTKSGSKTYYYNNNSGTAPSATVTWTQDAHIEKFTYEYHIYVGQKADTVRQKFMQFVWQCDQYNQSSKKTVFVGAYKSKINEQNQVVSNEKVEFGIKDSNLFDKFVTINNGNGLIDCFPTSNNLSYYYTNFGSFTLYVKESENVTCKVNLIQEKKDVQVIPGDAVMFTYKFDKNPIFSDATFLNLNLKNDNDDNHIGSGGLLIDQYKNILYYTDGINGSAGHSFIDFKNITKYLNEHGDDQSSIANKTILQSLTDKNGVISAQCDLYTNCYSGFHPDNVNLSYNTYNKDSEDATVTVSNHEFVLTGYAKINSGSDQVLCYADGVENLYNIKAGYTLVAKFTYYLDSGVFALGTNKHDVSKWHKGAKITSSLCTPSYSNVQFTNDGNNVNFSISIDSLNQQDFFDKNGIVDIESSIYQKKEPYKKELYSDVHKVPINQLPCKIKLSVPLADVIKKIDFSESNTAKIFPIVSFYCNGNINYSEEMVLTVKYIELDKNILTIQKQNA